MWAVIGSNGQLGRALMQRTKADNIPFIGYSRIDCDLSGSVSDIAAFAAGWPADIGGIILCAAETRVDHAEGAPESAFNINTRAPAIIARECGARDIPIIYVSTDYVFSGQAGHAYDPSESADPVNWYGYTKLLGERQVRAQCPKAIILRTSWVFDGTGKNFLTAMLQRWSGQGPLRIVGDQIGRPTYAGHLASAILRITQIAPSDIPAGVFHLTGSGKPVSWAGFARAIFKGAKAEKAVIDITSADYPQAAPRPRNSVLDMTGFETVFGFAMPDWREGLVAALREAGIRE